MILCVTFNPAVDTTLFIDQFTHQYRTDAQRIHHRAGGKGNNVGRALITLGQAASVLNPEGGLVGKMHMDLLAADGVKVFSAAFSGETRLAVTLVDNSGHQQACFAPSTPWQAQDAAQFHQAFAQALAGAQAVCLCGSSPSPLATPLFPQFIQMAKELGAVTLLDSYGPALPAGLEARPHMLKFNCAEAAGYLQRPLDNLEEQALAITGLVTNGVEWVVLTLGEHGALLHAAGQTWLARPPQVNVVNPIGSGDAFTAGLLAGRLQGFSPVECFRLGMACAVSNVTVWDACGMNKQQIDEVLAHIKIQAI
jgi:1-phosphofructokinase family hexose kinase